MQTLLCDESQLIEQSLAGDHEAFRQIVDRHQGLVCALAFSASGDVAESEDIAQETFLTAWRSLGQLRSAEKLKSWLCGIARNLANQSRRKRRYGAAGLAVSLDIAGDAPSQEATPHEQAVAREEAAFVREALLALPERYREPLVLFYREDQSIRTVADALGLTEDAVKQRLSRGRKMLHAQMAATLEKTLQQSKPSSALAIAIIASLPPLATQAKAATLASAAAKGLPIAKTAISWTLISSFGGALLQLAFVPMINRWIRRRAMSQREREFLVRYVWAVILLVIAFQIAIGALTFNSSFIIHHPVWFAIGLATSIIGLIATIVPLAFWATRRQKKIRAEERRRIQKSGESDRRRMPAPK